MPLYAIPQAGSNADPTKNLTSLVPGDSIKLLDGTEALGSGTKSVAFCRGYSPSGADNGITFDASGMVAGTEIDIQAANQDVDADYFIVGSIGPDANGNGGYTDAGRSAFYRAIVTTYVSGNPVLVAQR